MDAVFVKTANPVQSRCLGASLLPLSIGHLFLLRKYCADVLTFEDVEFGSLAVASFICAHEHSEVERLLSRRISPLVFRLWGWFSGKMDLVSERDRFQHYMQSNLEPPKFWHDLSNPLRTCQSPLEMRLLVMLMTELHYRESDALSVTVIKANALWATLGELRGKFSFPDRRIEGFFEFAQRMDAERANKVN
jgi:hypothetical protein